MVFKKKVLRKRNILSVIDVIMLTLFTVLFLKLDLVTLKLSAIIILSLLFINVLGIILLNLRKKILIGIGSFILVLSIIINGILSYYLYNTNSFLNKSFGSSNLTTTNTYYVVTSQSSNLSKNDISGEVAYYKDNVNIDKAISKLKDKYSVTTKSYDDVTTMFNDVLNGTMNFMIVEKSSYDLVFKLDDSMDAKDFKILYKISIKVNSDEAANVKDSFNVYVGGTDFTNNCMDFNMIVSINTKTNEVLMTSIPRDYYMTVVGVSDNKKDTLSYMAPYGITTSVKSLEKLFGIKIDYYIKVNTTSLVNVVDNIGGITYCSDQAYTTTHALVLDSYDDTKGKKLYVKKGCQEINGIEALTIARERNAFEGRDRVRQENCRKIIIAIFNKLNNVNTIKNYASILESFEGLYETNIPKKVISNVAKTTLDNNGNWKITEQEVNGSDAKDYVHLTNYKDWVMYPDMNTVNNATNKINEILN